MVFRLMLGIYLSLFTFGIANGADQDSVDLSQFVQSLEAVNLKGDPIPPVEDPGDTPRPLPMPPSEALSMQTSNANLKSVGSSWATQNPNLGTPVVSDIVSILSYPGGMLTVWALSPGTWVWGYAAPDTLGLYNLMEWQLYSYRDGFVVIENVATKTCLAGLNNGVIHTRCNPDSTAQRWIINHFANGSLQFKNVGYQKCLQTPEHRHRVYYTIYQVPCATGRNVDQQWTLMAGFRRQINPISK